MSEAPSDVPWFAQAKRKPAPDRPTFAALIERSRGLERAEFCERYPFPVLVTAVSFDPQTWSGTLVLPIRRGTGAAPPCATGAHEEVGVERVGIGRREDIDLRLPSASVSRDQAVFEKRDGAWHVRDLGSSNGTRLNGTPLKPNVLTRIIRSPASIEIGSDLRFVFFTPDTLFDLVCQARAHQSSGTKRATVRTAPAPAEPVDFALESSAGDESSTQMREAVTDTFENALTSLDSVADMVRSLEIHVEGRETALEIYARGGPITFAVARSRLVNMRPRPVAVRVRLGVGERRPITLYSRTQTPSGSTRRPQTV